MKPVYIGHFMSILQRLQRKDLVDYLANCGYTASADVVYNILEQESCSAIGSMHVDQPGCLFFFLVSLKVVFLLVR